MAYWDPSLKYDNLTFDDNNMIWWTVDSAFVSYKNLEKQFDLVVYYKENLKRLSEDAIVVLIDMSINELEDSLLKLKENRVLIISKMTLQQFQSICLTQFMTWFSPIYINSESNLFSYVYFLESTYFGADIKTWLPNDQMFLFFDGILQQSKSLRYFFDVHAYLKMFVESSSLYKVQKPLFWKELMCLKSFVDYAEENKKLKLRTESQFTKFFIATYEAQLSQFNEIRLMCCDIIQSLKDSPISEQLRFLMISTNSKRLKDFSRSKDKELASKIRCLIKEIEVLKNEPFHELFLIDCVSVLKKTCHVDVFEELKKNLDNFPQFASQFDKTNYSRHFSILFQVLKEMPVDANLYDTMMAFCTRSGIPKDSNSRLEFEMLMRDFETIGVISLTSKRDHVQKNLLYFT